MASPNYNEPAIDTIELVSSLDIKMAQTIPPIAIGPSLKEDDPFLVTFSLSDSKNLLN